YSVLLLVLSLATFSKANHSDVCNLPLDSGICSAFFPKWGYDVNEKECVIFIYGGCGGNDNSFEEKEECEAACGLAKKSAK
ncbi:unnamed protein product, partial [Hymenolepis diminuta]